MMSFPFSLAFIAAIASGTPLSGPGGVSGNAMTVVGVPLRQNLFKHGADGLIVRSFLALSPDRTGLTYAFIETGCTRCVTGIHIVGEFGSSYEIYQRTTPANANVATNGSFFGYDVKGKHVALGLVIADGHRNNRRIAWARGGFLVHSRAGNTRIVPVARYRQQPDDTSVIQSKPLLVEDGRNGIHQDDGERFNRTAVAITTSGKLLVAGAFEGFGRSASLYEFATFLLALRASDGSSVQWALAMDGGPGAQIYVPSMKLHFGDPGQNYVPNLVYIR